MYFPFSPISPKLEVSTYGGTDQWNLLQKEKNRFLLFSSSAWEIYSTLFQPESFFFRLTLLPVARPESGWSCIDVIIVIIMFPIPRNWVAPLTGVLSAPTHIPNQFIKTGADTSRMIKSMLSRRETTESAQHSPELQWLNRACRS